MNQYLRKFPTDELRYYAHCNPEEEVCGICLKDKTFIAAPNLAPDRTNHFLFDRLVLDENEGNVLAIFHTHILESDGSVLSPHDIEVSRTLETPYLLYSVTDDDWDYFDPTAIHPYPLEAEGTFKDPSYYTLWPFNYPRADCASTIRGWFLGMLGIRLCDYNRIDLETAIEQKLEQFGPNRWLENNFQILDKNTPLQDNDVIAIDIAGLKKAHHLAVIVSAADNTMLHNLGQGRFSEIIQYSDSWRSRTLHLGRHTSQMLLDDQPSPTRRKKFEVGNV